MQSSTVWCTITCGAKWLCHFAGGFCGLVNTPNVKDTRWFK